MLRHIVGAVALACAVVTASHGSAHARRHHADIVRPVYNAERDYHPVRVERVAVKRRWHRSHKRRHFKSRPVIYRTISHRRHSVRLIRTAKRLAPPAQSVPIPRRRPSKAVALANAWAAVRIVVPCAIVACDVEHSVQFNGSAKALEPIGPTDKVNIFAAYERNLLRPVGNCQEWETVDARTKRIVSDAAIHFGGVAKLSSCYRSVGYNRRVYARMKRRPTRSQHSARKALDFVIDVAGHLVDKDKLAGWVRQHPIMKKLGGVGLYRMAAIHVDVGPYRNWDWRRHAVHRHVRHHARKHRYARVWKLKHKRRYAAG